MAIKLVGLLVTAFVAARLGPTDFGYFTYVLSATSLVAVITHLGLQGLFQRELIEHPGRQAETLGTVFGLKMSTAIIGAGGLVAFGLWNPTHVAVERQLFAVLAAAVVLQAPGGIFATWFHTRTRSDKAVLANQLGLLGSALGKVLAVALGAGVVTVGLAHTAGVLLTTVALWAFFLRSDGPTMSVWRSSISRARSLLKESWVVFLSTLFATIYLKIDIVMLRDISGPAETGIYSLAAMLSEASWFIPAAIVTTLFPRLVEAKGSDQLAFERHMQNLYDILAISGLVVLAATCLLGPIVLHLFFGDAYSGAVPIMLVHALSLPFIFLRVGFDRWCLINRMTHFSLLTQGAGALLNVTLNLLLIPRMGGMGAAVATVVSYASASYLALLLASQTRGNFSAISRALLQPWRAGGTVVSMLRSTSSRG